MKRLIGISLTLVALAVLSGCGDKEQPGEGGVFMRVFGTEGDDKGYDVVQTSDGGFAVTGTLFSDSTDGNGQPLEGDIFLLRTNEFGEPLFQTKFANAGADNGHELVLRDGGGFMIVGDQSTEANGVDVVVVLTNEAGGETTTTHFGGAGSDYANAVAKVNDGWVIAGYSNSTPGGDYDVFLVKLDLNFALVSEVMIGTGLEERAFSVAATADGGVAVAGLAADSTLGYQAVVWKLDAGLNVEWEYRQGGFSEDKGYSIDLLPSGNLAFVGYTSDGGGYDIFFTELTASGSIVSTSTFGGADYDRVLAQHVLPQSNGKIIGVAYTQSSGNGANDIYFYQLAPSDSGYHLEADETYGGSNDDIGASIIPTQGGGFAIVGFSKSFTFGELNDIVLLKVSSSGKLN